MADHELRRDSQDRRSYVLPGIGTLRFTGLASRGAVAEADGSTWQFSRRGFWQRGIEAADAEGRVVGVFEPNALRRGGHLHWDGWELELRPASSWKGRSREHSAQSAGQSQWRQRRSCCSLPVCARSSP